MIMLLQKTKLKRFQFQDNFQVFFCEGFFKFSSFRFDLSVVSPNPMPNIMVMIPAKYGRNSDIFRLINQFEKNGKCHNTRNP
jgi:hypothetical protein